MKRDISTRADIEKIVNLFYEKVKSDELISHFFTNVINVDWEKHLPKMCDFWENVLLYTGDYEGNPLDTHRSIHTRHSTQAEHFDRWQQLFDEVIMQSFAGPLAEKMKQHAKAIAAVMQQKM
ncbi:MAG TPA: group III truncated hemoglobin [Niabella sp.]|nr:group III truncated hemoglobin [Niabella sp.]HOZ97228.1 group III truncated hemoglobin [Niabella sp.]HQW14194.1 group III truncated hemoglobin [Niabella sp.]HQX19594.1 group III truncated hemoglobin [Niabella sp.]HQX39972.1 group III truncated hemoglobin [Niabella sp.]